MSMSPMSFKIRSTGLSAQNLNLIYVVVALALSTTLAVSGFLFMLALRMPVSTAILRQGDNPEAVNCTMPEPVSLVQPLDDFEKEINSEVAQVSPAVPEVPPAVPEVPPAAPELDFSKAYTEAEMNALLTGQAAVFGKVDKQGMLPTEKWIPPYTNDTLREWVWGKLLGSVDKTDPRMVSEVPPKAGLCTILFNPVYKFIFVKNTKVAGTSLFLKFGGFCEQGISFDKLKENPNCMMRITDVLVNGLETYGYANWREMWEDYTVVSLVRNPYDRAGSSYDYTLGLRVSREGDCKDPTFDHFTSKPYMVGLQDTLFSCGDAKHDFYHVEPQHTCLLDDDSKLVTDMIIRVESLDEDLPAVLDVLNERRLEGAPKLEGGVGWEQRGPIADDQAEGGEESADTTMSRHASKFVECGGSCLYNLNQYYRTDFDILKYPVEKFD